MSLDKNKPAALYYVELRLPQLLAASTAAAGSPGYSQPQSETSEGEGCEGGFPCARTAVMAELHLRLVGESLRSLSYEAPRAERTLTPTLTLILTPTLTPNPSPNPDPHPDPDPNPNPNPCPNPHQASGAGLNCWQSPLQMRGLSLQCEGFSDTLPQVSAPSPLTLAPHPHPDADPNPNPNPSPSPSPDP